MSSTTSRPPNAVLRRGALAVLLLTVACVDPTRTPLPAPFPLTGGGTPVPGEGVGVGLQLGDGLQGQELYRKELVTGTLFAGIDDRIELSLGLYGGHDEEDPSGVLAAAKLRLGAPLGARSSTAVRVGVASVDRTDRDVQDESLLSLDFALPTEFLITPPESGSHLSAYLGPRLVYEDYADDRVPEESFTGWIPGVLAGLHFEASHFHLFGEGTVAFLPENEYMDAAYGGGTIFLPTAGIAVHLGSPFPWDRAAQE